MIYWENLIESCQPASADVTPPLESADRAALRLSRPWNQCSVYEREALQEAASCKYSILSLHHGISSSAPRRSPSGVTLNKFAHSAPCPAALLRASPRCPSLLALPCSPNGEWHLDSRPRRGSATHRRWLWYCLPISMSLRYNTASAFNWSPMIRRIVQERIQGKGNALLHCLSVHEHVGACQAFQTFCPYSVLYMCVFIFCIFINQVIYSLLSHLFSVNLDN